MSKRLVMSILSAAAMSIGGWFVSCGAPEPEVTTQAVVVQLPDGATLISPREDLAGMTAGLPVAPCKPGHCEFVIGLEGRMIQLDREVKPGQHTLVISPDELK